MTAMKIISPEEDESVTEFILEITILRKCKHKNLTAHYGSWIKGDELFIVMELCDGGTVGDFPSALNRGLKEVEIQQIVLGSLDGLAYMHASGIIHRDIKGANILLDSKGDVKLADFGVSYLMELNPGVDAKTFIGTPYWMAPEIIDTKSGGPPYDFKVDVWAIGITVIELAEMNPPLYDMNPMRALFEIPNRPAPRLIDNGEWSRALIDFVDHCCRKRPAERPSAKEMLQHQFLRGVQSEPKVLQKLSARFKAACDGDEKIDVSDSADDNSHDDLPTPLDDPDAPAPPKSKAPSVAPAAAAAAGKPGKAERSSSAAPAPDAERKSSHKASSSAAAAAAASSSSSSSSAPALPKAVKEAVAASNNSSSGSSPALNRRQVDEAAGARPNMTKRPTKRFTTRREVEHEANAFMNKRQLKRQMKELRTKQEKNIQELSQLQAKQDAIDDKRNKENSAKKAKLTKAQEESEEALTKKLGNDRAAQRKVHASDREKLIKALQGDNGKLAKALKADEARDQKEYKKKQKDKKAGQSDEEFARQLQWDDLMFVHHQQTQRLLREQAQALATRTQPYKQRIDHTREKHELQSAGRLQHHQWRLAALAARHEEALKNRELTHEIERKNLLEKQELQKAQLVSMQKLEIAQQKKQQLFEEKKRLHDFRLKQKLDAKNAQSKGDSRKSGRAAQVEQEDFMHQERETQAQALRALLDRHERIRDEQRLTHEKFQRILVEDQQMLAQNLVKTQKAQLAKLKEELDHTANKELLEAADELLSMYTAYYTNVTQAMEEHEAAQKELLLVQIKQQMGLLMEQQRTQAAAPERFSEQQAALKEKQRAQYAALVKDQASQMKAVKRERDAKLADIEKLQTDLRAKLAPHAAKKPAAAAAAGAAGDHDDDVADLAKSTKLPPLPDDDNVPDYVPSSHDDESDPEPRSRPEDMAELDKTVQKTLRITMLDAEAFDVSDIVGHHNDAAAEKKSKKKKDGASSSREQSTSSSSASSSTASASKRAK
jgi:serine/threonine protein kinase